MKLVLLNTRGQSLVQTLVAAGILSIILSAMTAATVNMHKSNKLLSQKLEVLDLKNQLQSTFLNPDTCTCQLNPTLNSGNSTNLKFDSTIATSSMNLKQLKSACAPSASELVKEDSPLLGTQTGLRVSSVLMTNIQATGNTDEYIGTIEVRLQGETLAGPLAPLRFLQKFYGDPVSPANAKTVARCRNTNFGLHVASASGVIGANNLGNVTIDLATYGFDPLGEDPHILVSERDSNYDEVDGNTMDASYCGYVRNSKLIFTVTCWASPNNSDGTLHSSFDWMAIQR